MIDYSKNPLRQINSIKRREEKQGNKKPKQCEKCGGELGVKLIGDESYDYCSECKMATS